MGERMLGRSVQPRPSCLSADIRELQILMDGHRAAAGSGAYLTGRDLAVFSRSAQLAKLAFLQGSTLQANNRALAEAATDWPWQPRDKGDPEPPSWELQSHVRPRRRVVLPAALSRVCRQATGKRRPRLPRSCPAGWMRKCPPNLVPGHRVLWLSLTLLTCFSSSYCLTFLIWMWYPRPVIPPLKGSELKFSTDYPICRLLKNREGRGNKDGGKEEKK